VSICPKKKFIKTTKREPIYVQEKNELPDVSPRKLELKGVL